MAITYAELTQAIEDFCENTETSFVSSIPIFVRSAEQRIYHSIQPPVTRKTSTSTAMVLGANTWAAPSDFLSAFEFSIAVPSTGATAFLLNKDVNFIREAYPVSSVLGVPAHYALTTVASTTPFATTFLLGPTPDAAYATTLDYFALPVSITAGTTSWLGDNFESVLLYGSLREANVYLKAEEDITANVDKMYQEALMLLKGLSDGKNRRDAYRSGQNRVQVP